MRTRPGQVRPLFLAASAGVLGLALLGVLLVGLLGDSTNGLLLGMGLLLLASLGGLGLAWFALSGLRGSRLREKSPEELRAELRRTPGSLVVGVIGASFGAAISPFFLLPALKHALPDVPDGPVLWIASIAAGALVGAGAAAIIWASHRLR